MWRGLMNGTALTTDMFFFFSFLFHKKDFQVSQVITSLLSGFKMPCPLTQVSPRLEARSVPDRTAR